MELLLVYIHLQLELITETGAVPYIPFKNNVSTKSVHKRGLIWKKALHLFLYNQEEFIQHYHKRSNVETTFSMVKKKFGDNVKSKNWNAQVNEVLCKIVCHNICVLIMEMENLGITAQLLNNAENKLII